MPPPKATFFRKFIRLLLFLLVAFLIYQFMQIVREDPHVLDSYQNFVDAAFGPQ